MLKRLRQGLGGLVPSAAASFFSGGSGNSILDQVKGQLRQGQISIDQNRDLTNQMAGGLGSISGLQSSMDMSLDVQGHGWMDLVSPEFRVSERARRERIHQLLTARAEGVSNRRARPGQEQTRFSVGSLI